MQIKFYKSLPATIRFPKHWIVYCLLFAITVQSSTPGVVLCFENDGHIEVEFGLRGKCCQAFKGLAQKASTFIISKQDCKSTCGICVDVPLYIIAEKKHNSEHIIQNQFVPLLQASYYSTTLINHSSFKKSFPSISTTAFHISTFQTVVLQV